MTEKRKILIVYLITAIFVLLNTFLIWKEIYLGMLLPLVGIMALLYIFSLDKILLLAVFVTPLAIDIGDYDLGAQRTFAYRHSLFHGAQSIARRRR